MKDQGKSKQNEEKNGWTKLNNELTSDDTERGRKPEKKEANSK